VTLLVKGWTRELHNRSPKNTAKIDENVTQVTRIVAMSPSKSRSLKLPAGGWEAGLGGQGAQTPGLAAISKWLRSKVSGPTYAKVPEGTQNFVRVFS